MKTMYVKIGYLYRSAHFIFVQIQNSSVPGRYKRAHFALWTTIQHSIRNAILWSKDTDASIVFSLRRDRQNKSFAGIISCHREAGLFEAHIDLKWSMLCYKR